MENQNEENQQTESGPGGAKPSLLGMITNPGEQWAKIKENPRFWLPLLVVTLLSVIGSILAAFAIPEDLLQSELPELSAEEAEIALMIGRIGAGIGGLFVPIVTLLVYSAIHMLITMIVGTGVRFKQLLSFNTYIYFILAIGLLFNSLIRLLIGGDPYVYVTSLGSIIEAEGATGAVLNGVEVFSIWHTILLALGLNRVGGLSSAASWGFAIAFFIVGLLLSMIGLQ